MRSDSAKSPSVARPAVTSKYMQPTSCPLTVSGTQTTRSSPVRRTASASTSSSEPWASPVTRSGIDCLRTRAITSSQTFWGWIGFRCSSCATSGMRTPSCSRKRIPRSAAESWIIMSRSVPSTCLRSRSEFTTTTVSRSIITLR